MPLSPAYGCEIKLFPTNWARATTSRRGIPDMKSTCAITMLSVDCTPVPSTDNCAEEVRTSPEKSMPTSEMGVAELEEGRKLSSASELTDTAVSCGREPAATVRTVLPD